MEKQYKLTDRVSKDSLKSPTFKKWLKRVLCFVFIFSLVLQLTLCCLPMQASAANDFSSYEGVWQWNNVLSVPPSYIHSEGFIYSDDSNSDVIFSVQSFNGKVFAELSSNDLYYDGLWYGSRVFNLTIDPNSGYDRSAFINYLNSNATKVSNVGDVYDFTGEYRLFNDQLSNLNFAQSGTVTQSYKFDFNIWGGYNADYFLVQADGSSVDISYSFTDDGSGGIKTVYRQLLRDGKIVGTWLVPRARLIYFQSNPDDPTFQQWLLDNTTLIDEAMIESVYGFGYDNGYNDGWTNSAIGDTFKAPVDALNSIILLDIGGTTITLGGVIFTMVVLSIMLIFLKKYAGG